MQDKDRISLSQSTSSKTHHETNSCDNTAYKKPNSTRITRDSSLIGILSRYDHPLTAQLGPVLP